MAGYGSGQGRPVNSGRNAYNTTDQAYNTTDQGYQAGQDYLTTGTPAPGFDPPAAMRHAAGSKGFIGSLFDLGFTSFVTPKVIRVLYLLIIIGTVISGLIYSFVAFKVSPGLGILTLFILAPLCSLIVLALWRITLEFFMIIFRISDDISALRQRGEFR
jgi:Domain of unknown function (DUF4282)